MAGTRRWIKQSGDSENSRRQLRHSAASSLNPLTPGQHRNPTIQLEHELEPFRARLQPSGSVFIVNNLADDEAQIPEEPPLVASLSNPNVIEPLVNQESSDFPLLSPQSVLSMEHGKRTTLPLREEEEEIEPLIRREPQPPLYKSAGQLVVRNAKAVAAQYRPFVSKLLENKIATAIAILASMTAALLAFANAYGIPASQISIDIIRYNSRRTLTYALVSAYSALHVNVPFNLSFLLSGRKKIESVLKNMTKSPRNFITTSILIIFALCAAFASGALTLNTFLFAGYVIAVIQGVFQSVPMNATSRLTGLITAEQTLSNVVKHSARARVDLIDAFNHLNKDVKVELSVADFEKEFDLNTEDLGIARDERSELSEQRVIRSTGDILNAVQNKHIKRKLANKHETLMSELTQAHNNARAVLTAEADPTKLDPNQLEEAFKKLQDISAKCKKGAHLDDVDYERLLGELIKALMVFDKLPEDPLHPFYKSRHWTEYTAYYLHTLAQISLGLVGGLVTTAVFAQNGFNAFNYASQWTTGNNLSDLDVWYRRLIGFPCGVGPGTLYAISIALSIHHYFTTLPLYIWRHKSDFSAMACLTISLCTQYFASGSPRGTARGAVTLPNNILGPLSTEGMQNTTETIMQVAGGMTNFAPTLRDLVHHFDNPDHPTVEETLKHFADPNGHKTDNYTDDLIINAANRNRFFPPLAAPIRGGEISIKKKKPSKRDKNGDRLSRDDSYGNLISIGSPTKT